MTPNALIPIREVCRQSGLSRSSVYQRIQQGTFPAPVHLGSSARWSERRVQAWVEEQIASADRARLEAAS